MQSTNFNRLHGIPEIEELSFPQSDDLFAEWLLKEHKGTLKVPEVCPQCNGELTLQQRRMRCHACKRNGTEFHQTVWENGFFAGARNKRKVMTFLCHWPCSASTKQLGTHTGWSKSTAQTWLTKAQEPISIVVTFDHQLASWWCWCCCGD